MQKKKDEISGFKLLVIIALNAVKDPIKYDPLSPKKIFALGKLNKRKDIKIINWPVKNVENSLYPLLMFKKTKTVLMIIKFIVSNPLNPSIRFAPFIINKKHNKTKIVEKKLFFKNKVKKGMSILEILIGKK